MLGNEIVNFALEYLLQILSRADFNALHCILPVSEN